MEFWMTEKRARAIAGILRALCCLVVTFAAVCAVLMLLGRVSVDLTTPEGHYDHALLSEKDHSVTSRVFFYTFPDKVQLTTESEVAVPARVAIALMGLLRVFPIGFCFFLMIRFFGNLLRGRVFVRENARLFLTSAAVLLAVTVVTPLFNVLVFPGLVNLFTDNTLSVGMQADLVGLFFGAVLLVAAYVFHYGIYLQDEADHTL